MYTYLKMDQSCTRSTNRALNVFVNMPRGRWALFCPFYSTLNSCALTTSLSYVSQWDRDLMTTIDLADWSWALSSVAKCSFNLATLQAAYKVLFRWYWVPARIPHANPNCTDRCLGTCGHCGDVLHIWWVHDWWASGPRSLPCTQY